MPTTSSIVSKVASIDAIVDEIQSFLRAPTSSAWVDHALGDLSTLLIDHANCEYKAAATGMSLITKYRQHPRLQRLMARLVREEMLHYEQVLMFMEKMGVEHRPLTASRYARSLRESIRTTRTDALLICLWWGLLLRRDPVNDLPRSGRICRTRWVGTTNHCYDLRGGIIRTILH